MPVSDPLAKKVDVNNQERGNYINYRRTMKDLSAYDFSLEIRYQIVKTLHSAIEISNATDPNGIASRWIVDITSACPRARRSSRSC
jgi:hypothetical protein